jgi:hypothetical protein
MFAVCAGLMIANPSQWSRPVLGYVPPGLADTCIANPPLMPHKMDPQENIMIRLPKAKLRRRIAIAAGFAETRIRNWATALRNACKKRSSQPEPGDEIVGGSVTPQRRLSFHVDGVKLRGWHGRNGPQFLPAQAWDQVGLLVVTSDDVTLRLALEKNLQGETGSNPRRRQCLANVSA